MDNEKIKELLQEAKESGSIKDYKFSEQGIKYITHQTPTQKQEGIYNIMILTNNDNTEIYMQSNVFDEHVINDIK